jgi:hypothetical protein
MTVAELGEMDNAEYVRWSIYHARRAQKMELARMMAESRSGKG